MRKKTALVVGGTSGLGLEIARLLSSDHQVLITGRVNPKIDRLEFYRLGLDGDSLSRDLDVLMYDLPEIDTLVYAAGFLQEGRLSELGDEDILKMERVGLTAPAMLCSRLLREQRKIGGLMVVTSTSQWTPRLLEPMYTAVKAGLAMLAHSVSLDERVGKVLVLAPAGMRTHFWEGADRDTSGMLDPAWVAKQAMDLWREDFGYRFAKVLREPARVEVVETRE